MTVFSLARTRLPKGGFGNLIAFRSKNAPESKATAYSWMNSSSPILINGGS